MESIITAPIANNNDGLPFLEQVGDGFTLYLDPRATFGRPRWSATAQFKEVLHLNVPGFPDDKSMLADLLRDAKFLATLLKRSTDTDRGNADIVIALARALPGSGDEAMSLQVYRALDGSDLPKDLKYALTMDVAVALSQKTDPPAKIVCAPAAKDAVQTPAPTPHASLCAPRRSDGFRHYADLVSGPIINAARSVGAFMRRAAHRDATP